MALYVVGANLVNGRSDVGLTFDLDESNFPSLKVRLRFAITDISILVAVHVLP